MIPAGHSLADGNLLSSVSTLEMSLDRSADLARNETATVAGYQMYGIERTDDDSTHVKSSDKPSSKIPSRIPLTIQ
jgi:hypothetical protein